MTRMTHKFLEVPSRATVNDHNAFTKQYCTQVQEKSDFIIKNIKVNHCLYARLTECFCWRTFDMRELWQKIVVAWLTNATGRS